ncbi:MAG: ABC transporter permease [Lachnospiraceae bacterium]|nr:ABC transporter permease [Lachnospiraceae bacterium]
MKNIITIIKKQFRDTVKNKPVLIQFLMFPVMTLIFENAIDVDMPELFFVKMFSCMYVGMAPLVASASIISEEKEKNTLRVLMMAGVRPFEYLIGIAAYIWILCMAGSAVMATSLPSEDIPFFMTMMGAGSIISIFIGACIGIFAKNQMVSTSLMMPVMMILSFSPMLAMFNDKIEKVARFVFTQQLKVTVDGMSFENAGRFGACVLFANAAVALVLFFMAFRKKGLE